MYLKRQAKAMREDEERMASIKIQKCMRGYLGGRLRSKCEGESKRSKGERSTRGAN